MLWKILADGEWKPCFAPSALQMASFDTFIASASMFASSAGPERQVAGESLTPIDTSTVALPNDTLIYLVPRTSLSASPLLPSSAASSSSSSSSVAASSATAQRFIVWNSTGYKPERRKILEGLVAKYKVDVVILIEGGGGTAQYSDGQADPVTCIAINEKREANLDAIQLGLHREEAALKSALQLPSDYLRGSGGVSTSTQYQIGSRIAVDTVLDLKSVHYEKIDSCVRAWVLEPAYDYFSKQAKTTAALTFSSASAQNLAGGAHHPASTAASVAAASVSSVLPHPVAFTHASASSASPLIGPSSSSSSRPKRAAASAPPMIDVAWKAAYVEVQNRANYLSAKRPKTIKIGALTIYIWHAPLGGNGSNSDSAMSSSGAASGGNDARVHNQLFSKFHGPWTGKEILVGDLNIDAAEVQNIYRRAPSASSHDPWCHVLAGDQVIVKVIQSPPLDRPTMGDHAPLVFSVEY